MVTLTLSGSSGTPGKRALLWVTLSILKKTPKNKNTGDHNREAYDTNCVLNVSQINNF